MSSGTLGGNHISSRKLERFQARRLHNLPTTFQGHIDCYQTLQCKAGLIGRTGLEFIGKKHSLGALSAPALPFITGVSKVTPNRNSEGIYPVSAMRQHCACPRDKTEPDQGPFGQSISPSCSLHHVQGDAIFQWPNMQKPQFLCNHSTQKI